MISKAGKVMLSLVLLVGLLAQGSSQKTKRRNARNDTKTINLESGGTVTINNYINCPPDSENSRGAKRNTNRTNGRRFSDDKNDCPLTSYEFSQSQQTSDYIRVKTPLPDMYSGTICAWINTGKEGNIEGTLASYATARQFNSIILYGHVVNNTTSILDVFINDEGYFTQLLLPANRQIHLCAAFSVLDGYVKLYVDGELSQTLARFQKRMVVEGGGVFIIGQEQDGLATGFAENQSYKGTVDNFMMWERELTANEIRSMANEGCLCPTDYILSLRHDSVMLMGGVAAKMAKKCPADA